MSAGGFGRMLSAVLPVCSSTVFTSTTPGWVTSTRSFIGARQNPPAPPGGRAGGRGTLLVRAARSAAARAWGAMTSGTTTGFEGRVACAWAARSLEATRSRGTSWFSATRVTVHKTPSHAPISNPTRANSGRLGRNGLEARDAGAVIRNAGTVTAEARETTFGSGACCASTTAATSRCHSARSAAPLDEAGAAAELFEMSLLAGRATASARAVAFCRAAMATFTCASIFSSFARSSSSAGGL